MLNTNAGGALKSTVTQPTPGGWNLPNTGATNSSGFSAGPGGQREDYEDFVDAGYAGYWWSSSLSGPFAWFRYLAFNVVWVGIGLQTRTQGFSVRCLRDSSVGGGGSASLPSVTTVAISGVTSTGASTGGDVTSDGGSAVASRGVAYSLLTNPTILGNITTDGSGVGSFVSTLTGLNSNTQYHVRAYALNSAGTAYGNEVTFTTLPFLGQPCPGTPTVSDIDGNIYNTVKIGNQCWTQSNLKVSRYRNGDTIPTGLNDAQWVSTTSGAYAIYDNDSVNDILFGKLYNHYAVTDSRGLCPTGWHVPSNQEWTTLETFLGGSSVAGGALKSTATQPTLGGWFSPNTGATNSSGFSAGPGGQRFRLGDFRSVGNNGFWWSSSLSTPPTWVRNLNFDYGGIVRNDYFNRPYGFSVRCLKD